MNLSAPISMERCEYMLNDIINIKNFFGCLKNGKVNHINLQCRKDNTK